MYYQDNGTYSISGTGDRGSGKGWVNYKGGSYYTKSISEELYNMGYLNKNIEIILDKNRKYGSIDNRNLPCNTNIDDPRLYMFHFDGNRYSFAAYIENATKQEKEHLKNDQYYGDGIDGTCTRY